MNKAKTIHELTYSAAGRFSACETQQDFDRQTRLYAELLSERIDDLIIAAQPSAPVPPVETLLYTHIVRDELFIWQERVMKERGAPLRVDTWQFDGHPTPNGEPFTLYACTMVLENTTKIEGEARRGALR